MISEKLSKSLGALVAASMLLTACGAPTAPAAPAKPTEAPKVAEPAKPAAKTFQIPEVVAGKFNVAMVLIGPHDDSGWSQAHYEGLLAVEKNVPDSHVAYIEFVPEGADSEQVFRSLARKGFNLVIGTSFGYMDPMGTVAEEFPDAMFVHLTGFKTNGKNFGNLFGAMEVMKYITGMLSGARMKKDGQTKAGYMATFPIPEELRLGNAFALGMAKTCPECKLEIRWINTWHDPVIEKEAAASLFDSGVHVVLTGADTPAPGDVATEKGKKWGINYDWSGNCTKANCLTTPYWNWGPIYSRIAQESKDKKYKIGFEYFDADAGAMGIYGLMEGQQPTPGMKDLDPADMKLIKDTLAAALAGKFTRFDVFAGPIKDNKGKDIVPAGGKIEQIDIDCFAGGQVPCKTGMYWWNSNVTAELPKL
jgi:basic membrane protein A and related proteins